MSKVEHVPTPRTSRFSRYELSNNGKEVRKKNVAPVRKAAPVRNVAPVRNTAPVRNAAPGNVAPINNTIVHYNNRGDYLRLENEHYIINLEEFTMIAKKLKKPDGYFTDLDKSKSDLEEYITAKGKSVDEAVKLREELTLILNYPEHNDYKIIRFILHVILNFNTVVTEKFINDIKNRIEGPFRKPNIDLLPKAIRLAFRKFTFSLSRPNNIQDQIIRLFNLTKHKDIVVGKIKNKKNKKNNKINKGKKSIKKKNKKTQSVKGVRSKRKTHSVKGVRSKRKTHSVKGVHSKKKNIL